MQVVNYTNLDSLLDILHLRIKKSAQFYIIFLLFFFFNNPAGHGGARL